ncbi:hypothetical protein NDU88_012706 [Pleurodeles waltl]|uniref:Uncharacterized protein n=1 Tax=Pleurodeles waltl TaxID=8319 RepID=A0AAV7R2F0_PLEWA|nr:hypothetical protein NDU88_012706 [Pleurodeles waltl]
MQAGGALYLLIAVRERRSSQLPAPPNAPRAPSAQHRVPEARAKAPRRRLTRRGRGRQHSRPLLLHGIQGDPGVARRVTDSPSGPEK